MTTVQTIYQIPAGVKALIFDIDGTLVDSMPVHFNAWSRCLEEAAGVELTKEVFDRFAGMSRKDIHKYYEETYGTRTDYDVLDRIHIDAYRQDRELIRPLRPVLSVLWEYCGKYPVALATAEIREIADINIGIAGIKGMYDILLTAEDVERTKPDPEVYLKAAGLLGVDAAECLVFEDSANGMAAAAAAGMKVVDVNRELMGF